MHRAFFWLMLPLEAIATSLSLLQLHCDAPGSDFVVGLRLQSSRHRLESSCRPSPCAHGPESRNPHSFPFEE
ncbi:hypothetical protein P171DRAFT_429210 [Karstenula rhodostoma CBS 690.94]|uniref:Secreted protein n=1 Tax=Karstenula rhodostoma CBS 690.94 TaxID=1392251 RepID=A0A9P4PP62_9PLEO|nr:hypothetical protein P171DRAFT_429210 [Karstenula rhodostoma CBS 690.94]